MGTNRLAVGVLCVSTMFGISSAAQAQRWFKSFDVGSIHTRGDASYQTGFGANAGIRMGPNVTAGLAAFDGAFTVPPEYVPGSPLYLGVFWHTDSAIPCGIELRPSFTSFARIGSPHIQGPNASGGLEPLDGSSVLLATAANTTNLKIYTITSPVPGRNLQPFDAVNFGLFRRSDAPSDTCVGNLIVSGVALAIL